MKHIQFDDCYVELSGAIARIVLDRPDRHNAIGPRMEAEFQQCLDIVEADGASRVVVVKGNGRSFCSGYDLRDHVVGVGGSAPKRRSQWDDLTWTDATARRYERLWRLSKPTIAQVHGYCVAGGCMVALQCDLVYVADDAIIGQPQARTLAMMAGFVNWPLTIGTGATKELFMTGDLIDGTEAAALGMVNKALPAAELQAYVEWTAARIAAMPEGSCQIAKHAVNEVADAMGYQGVNAAATHGVVLHHYLPANAQFKEQVRSAGRAREAVSARDAQHGGMVPRRRVWQSMRDALTDGA
ncbi:enoyl-CoA hydratase-related protein [Mycobacterium sp. NPDC003449]